MSDIERLRDGLGLALLSAILVGCASSPPTAPPTLNAPTPVLTEAPTAAPQSPGSGASGSPTGALCDEEESERHWLNFPESVRAYALAWNDPKPTRVILLEDAWSDDGSFLTHTIEGAVVGRQDLADAIGKFHSDHPEHFFVVSAWSPGDVHHDRVRIRWQACDRSRVAVLEGEDIIRFGADGLILEAVRFDDGP